MENSKKSGTAFIEIKRDGIKCGYPIVYFETEKTAYIPAFDIFFTCTSGDQAKKRASNLVDSFFDFWVLETGWKKFILEIHKLGFRAPKHDLVMKELLAKRPLKAKFSSDFVREMPVSASKGQVISMESTLAV